MGFTREGSYYYGLSRDMSDVYFATIDPSEGGLSAAPTKVTQRFEGTNGGLDWSTDGGKIAFVSKREGSWVIVTHTVDTGEEREIPVPEFDYIGSGQHLRWSPDGRSFLVIAHRGDWRWGVFTIDSDSGSVTALAWHDPGGALLQAQWSPDGKAVFFERRADDGPSIARLDLETRKESVVYPRQVGIMALSPDGRWVAFTTDVNWPEDEDEVPTLWVVPATGGEPRVLFRSTQSRPFHRGTPLAWTPDGRHVILGRSAQAAHPGGKGDELWKIPVEGGEPRKLGVSPTPIRHLRVHPDGKRVAFQSSTRKVEVWVMENFLPELKGETVSEVRP
jgi:Tol biopolymer transport system component